MQISCQCPSCGMQFQIPQKALKPQQTSLRCPACSSPVPIPKQAPPEDVQEEPATSPRKAPAPPQRSAKYMPCPFCQDAVPVGSRRCPACNAVLIRAEIVDSTILSAGDADAQYSTESPDIVRGKEESTSGIAGMDWLGGGRQGKSANDAVAHPDIPAPRAVGLSISSSISTRTRRGPDKTVWLMIGGALLAVVLLTSLVLLIVVLQGKEPAASSQASLLLSWPVKERFMGTVTIDNRKHNLPGGGPEEIKYPLAPGTHHLVLTREGFETIDAELTLKEGDKFSYRPEWNLAKAAGATGSELPKPVEQPKPKPVEQPKPKPAEPPKAEPAKPAEPPKPADKPKPTEPAKPKGDEKPKAKPAEPAKPKDPPKPEEKPKPKADEKPKTDDKPKDKPKPKEPDKYQDSGVL